MFNAVRYQSLLVAVLPALLLSGFGPAVAQDRTVDDNPFADLGLPEIAVTITNDAFEGVPAELPAGRYIVSMTNDFEDSGEATEGVAFVQLPAKMTAAEFIADDAQWPPWRYETRLAGGPYAALGETGYAVIDLIPGEWIVWGESPGAPQSPVQMTITGEFPTQLPTPTADTTIELTEFAFSFGAPLAAGPQTIELVNAGEQPHFVFIGGVPDGTNVAEARAAFAAYFDPAASPPAAFSFAESPEYLGTGDQSAGTTAWYAVDLPAGTAVVACFVTDPESGLPHDMLGMTEIVVIE